ncbi:MULTISPECIES: MucR family transcriptional regulator [unclassified Caulobacter]|jgi:predicted transcriptional regulator|uniref:MucR family transcriptional regulator n=1 Tax=unclassified Caulobacter TaxID=2648921 RepID=UPI0013C8311F|nr:MULTISPECIES: MucR family transcriptional regulator [unclassified Caulobacter]MBC6980823.1 MucR family transcriptional regulator [Caulobacter sp. 17J80-11]NEX92071.1 MucR family transcriptional regulator [Caulobacter sp. 17J65-9]
MNLHSEIEAERRQDLLRLSAEVVSAYVTQNPLQPQAIPELIHSVHQTLTRLGEPIEAPRPLEKQKPAVPVSKSVQNDHIVCLEDGKKLKMLKRYLRSKYDMTPEDYRRKWNLPPDYPMVAPAYAARRSDFAKQIGLGKGVRRRVG